MSFDVERASGAAVSEASSERRVNWDCIPRKIARRASRRTQQRLFRGQEFRSKCCQVPTGTSMRENGATQLSGPNMLAHLTCGDNIRGGEKGVESFSHIFNRLMGKIAESCKVAVTGPSVDGKANDARVDLIASVLRAPKSSVSLVGGAQRAATRRSRSKVGRFLR